MSSCVPRFRDILSLHVEVGLDVGPAMVFSELCEWLAAYKCDDKKCRHLSRGFSPFLAHLSLKHGPAVSAFHQNEINDKQEIFQRF